ncbi:MAG TPA: DUF1801 domain-containing protein [Candidatus Paceibacterota bacterium]|nr:DUF1801 domain-containing protein [Candidatus Paceibacterota bacterium]
MGKATTLKTTKTNASVKRYVQTLSPNQQADTQTLLDVFTSATKTEPRLWGESIVGFGEYTYTRSDGSEHQFLATGFALRKSGPTIYIMPGYNDYSEILKNLGPHKLGKGCLYVKSLDGIHLPTLKKLIRAGLRDLQESHSVNL